MSSTTSVIPPTCTTETVTFRFDILDPAPDGKTLEYEDLHQALDDLSGIADFAMLDDLGMAAVSVSDGPKRLLRHRIFLVATSETSLTVVDDAIAYWRMCFPSHLVIVTHVPSLIFGPPANPADHERSVQ